jgi:mannose-6-phosphate isomerase-like protein (cupin superfamily)
MSDCATPKILFETPTALPLEDAFDGGPTSRFCSPARASEVALGLRHEAISPIYRNLRPRLLLRQALHILGVLLRLGLAFEAAGGHVADFAEDGTRRRCGLGAGRRSCSRQVYPVVDAVEAQGTPLHLHRATDETFYVLEGTLGFRVGQQTMKLSEGAFVFVPKGLEHEWWNGDTTPVRLLTTLSPAGFERYFEELVEGLAAAGDDAQAAMSLR